MWYITGTPDSKAVISNSVYLVPLSTLLPLSLERGVATTAAVLQTNAI